MSNLNHNFYSTKSVAGQSVGRHDHCSYGNQKPAEIYLQSMAESSAWWNENACSTLDRGGSFVSHLEHKETIVGQVEAAGNEFPVLQTGWCILKTPSTNCTGIMMMMMMMIPSPVRWMFPRQFAIILHFLTSKRLDLQSWLTGTKSCRSVNSCISCLLALMMSLTAEAITLNMQGKTGISQGSE